MVTKTDWWRRKLSYLKAAKEGHIYTPEEAKAEFDIDIEVGGGVKVVPYEKAESGYGFSYITSEGWEITPDELYISPKGKRYTKAEIEEQQEAYKAQQADIELLKPYLTEKGYDVRAAREAGIQRKRLLDYSVKSYNLKRP